MFVLKNGISRSFCSPHPCISLKTILQETLYEKRIGSFFSSHCANFQRPNKVFLSCRSFYSSADRRKKKDHLSRQEAARIQFLTSRLDKKKAPMVHVWRNITVEELSKILEQKPKTVLEATRDFVTQENLYRKKSDVMNDLAIVGKVCKIFGRTPTFIKRTETAAELVEEDLDAHPRPPPDEDVLVRRAPVVTIMGHVDHGKTTLLDSLRNTNVVASEFGGITQHIGAFSVKLNEKDIVTFIDTPGHAAFTSMRSRGAQATDIVVLVVAADDGVMEQTVESIRMAQEAKVPIIVAINKIDKPLANIKRVEEMLSMQGIHTENMNGDVQAIPISALEGTNLDTLIEAILVQAEIMDLKADPTGFAEGVILESKQDPHRGKLASAIIHRGTLRKGAVLVAGNAHAKVRLMFSASGTQLNEAPPSTPVEMMGWRELPAAGDSMLEVESEKRAQQVLTFRSKLKQKEREALDAEVISKKQKEHKEEYTKKRRTAFETGRFVLKEALQKTVLDTTPKVSIIIKGDVDGSVDAILDVLETYHNEDVPLDIVTYGVGDVTENDVEMANAFNAIIYSFNVKAPPKVHALAKEKGISVRPLNIIYRLIDDLKKELSKKLPFFDVEEIIGEADVLQQFEFTEKKKKTIIVGLRVKKGELLVSERIKLIRNGQIVHDGTIQSMKHLKSEVKQLRSGIEGGVVLDMPIDVQLGDILICYRIKQEQKVIDWDPGF